VNVDYFDRETPLVDIQSVVKSEKKDKLVKKSFTGKSGKRKGYFYYVYGMKASP